MVNEPIRLIFNPISFTNTYPQQHNTLDNVHDNPATTTSNMGGAEEDPLPTTGIPLCQKK
jgi:hypothetical protein